MTHAYYVFPRGTLNAHLKTTWSTPLTVLVVVLIAVAVGVGLIWAFATGLIDLSPVVISQIGKAKFEVENVRIGNFGWMDPDAMGRYLADMFRIPL
ncbi:hypothetical protein COY32_00700 [candidate division WWE3 bacterium CG_4_10_14_0_2_um_filter_41_14]|uniref:Uncharacterized protein n=1 Tax=candidate division WWE3 bacterium CG_4_10_14_0_2_um_filter_41_14 TaxID=1975072 RepID=A0A2M7TLN1_UNCKA|nr:MAG: hypothetical protein COY32_00700 [candidate division WWE3 bacterium CG_4_10_14_0_2_um_filter_41_14]